MRNRLDLPENTEVLLYFSENTDMRKLEKELLVIYGPGKSKSDIYSLYENSINRVRSIDARANIFWTMAGSLDFNYFGTKSRILRNGMFVIK